MALAPGYTVGADAHGNPIFLYKGKPLTQQQLNQQHGGFTPYQAPSSPSPGTYDPSLDAQQENANTGFGYAAQDYDLGGLRNQQDYRGAVDQLSQNRQATLTDLLTGNHRANQDFDTQRQQLDNSYDTGSIRAAQDRDTATQGIQRQYTNLGQSQADAISAAGEGEGGALAQALAKRTANQAIDQQGVNTGYQRQAQDLQTGHDTGLAGLLTARDRTNADYATQTGRVNTDYATQTGALGQNYQRATDDANTNYLRQGVQNAAFGQQINAQKTYEAQQAGMLPTGPDNEHTNTAGQTFRTEIHNGTVYHRYADGRLVPIRKATH